MTASPPPPGETPDRPPFQPSTPATPGAPSWRQAPPPATQPPGAVVSARVLLLINAVLLGLVALLRFIATWPTGAEANAENYGEAFGVALLPALLAIFSVILARRLELGRRSTRIWTIVVAVLTALLGLSVVAALAGLVILSLPLLGLSIAVLVLINLADARRFFRGPSDT